MHGRIRPVSLVFLFWFVASLIQDVPSAPAVHAASDDRILPPEPSAKQSQKKRSTTAKSPRVRSHAPSPRKNRSTSRQARTSTPDDQTSKGANVRRHAARSALLQRLAAASLLSGRDFGEARILDTWRIRLVDGDTFWYGGERIRVRGYDAPERSQPGGFDATQRLEALLHEGEVRMYSHGLDVYGRTLADVYVEQRNVADVMIAEGYAKKR